MVAMVPLLTPVSGYYTTFYNHIAMVLTPLRDLGKTMAEPHSILQGAAARYLHIMNFELFHFCGIQNLFSDEHPCQENVDVPLPP